LTIRELWVCDGIGADYVREDLDFPNARQVGYIKKTIYIDGKLKIQDDRYGITSHVKKDFPPMMFLDTTRKHWEIENGLHHVKDRSWGEDHQYTNNQLMGGVLGVLRSLSLNAMRVIRPPDPDRKKRKYQKSLPKQAIEYLAKPLVAISKLLNV